MPPPTPSTAFIRSGVLFDFGGFSFLPVGVVVLHQTAAYFLHRRDGRLSGGRWQHRTGAVLELASSLGGDDDEAIGASLAIVRNRVCGVDAFRHCWWCLPVRNSRVWGGFAAPFVCAWLVPRERCISAVPRTPPRHR